MNTPRVSIGLTVFNGAQFLEQTLESFLAQTYTDFELIISDNASTDRTEDIARSYATRDNRVRYYRNEKNVGLAGNHNRVFAHARGEYFKWAAADDICRPTYLARCAEVLEREPAVVLVYPKTEFIDAAGHSLDIDDPGWDLRSNDAHERMRYVIFAGHWANAVVGLIRTKALARTRLMPSYPGGDFRVLGELSLLGKFFEIPEALFARRLHTGSSSQHAAAGVSPDQNWLAHYWTGRERSVSMPEWNLNIDHFRSILRSQLRLHQKLSLVRSLLRQMRWRRGKLSQELCSAIAAYIPKIRPSVRLNEVAAFSSRPGA
jgi:glycosyltransferase involved in cell wall biosynthesis